MKSICQQYQRKDRRVSFMEFLFDRQTGRQANLCPFKHSFCQGSFWKNYTFEHTLVCLSASLIVIPKSRNILPISWNYWSVVMFTLIVPIYITRKLKSLWYSCQHGSMPS